jgi:hypothetical protein
VLADDVEPRLVVVDVVVLAERDERTPRAVVVQLVDVEAAQHLAAPGEQVLRRDARRSARGQEPVEGMDEDRAVAGGRRVGRVVSVTS